VRETGLNCDGVREFLRYTHDNNVPLDFLSTHGYADENYEQDAPGSITRLDPTHGNTLAAYRKMGSPR
jgi:hypothetical protein